MTTLILAGLVGLLQLVSLVIFVIVLIKLFKHGGILKGILGLFCGIFTFIWGWMKHKELQLTKMMTVWSILIVASIVLQAMAAGSGMMQLMQYAAALKGNSKIAITRDGLMKKFHKETVRLKSQKNNMARFKQHKKALAQSAPATQKVDWNQQALALWQNGRYTNPTRALDSWNHVISIHPEYVEAYNNRGLAYYNLKLYPQALADYRQAIRMRPSYAAAYNNRGNAYYQMAHYQKAAADFNRSIRLRPNDAGARMNRALAYYQLGKAAHACGDFKKACDLGDCSGWNWARKNGVCR